MPWMTWTTSNMNKCPIKYEFSQHCIVTSQMDFLRFLLRDYIHVSSFKYWNNIYGLRYSWQNTLDWLCISARFRHWICLVLRVVMTNLQHAWAPFPLFPVTIKTWPGVTNCIFIICTTLLNGTGVAKEADYCQSLYSIFLDLCLDKEYFSWSVFRRENHWKCIKVKLLNVLID